ncbi:unnamed protein product [Malus baccata var. baccata]
MVHAARVVLQRRISIQKPSAPGSILQFRLDKIGEQMDNRGGKYDVFLSFRGEIRKGFTDHLYVRLKDYEFNVFLDEDELPRGDPITEKLKQAIKETRLAVIMFSKGYAESRWCLEELVEIMECRKTKGQFVFPIFYDVDPSDVRHQTGSFATAFQNHEQRFTEEKVREWRKALTAAAELSGEHFQKNNGMVELHLNHSPKLTKILGLHKSLNTMRRIHMEGCTNLTAAFRKAILQGWSASRNGDLFCPGNDLLSGFTCVDPKDEIVSALFIPGNDLPSGFTCVDPKKEIVVPQCFGDDAKALTLCIVYSCNDSQSSDSLCIRVENRTKETEISSSPMFATVLNRHESNIWLGHLSNNTLNVNGGDKINVGASFVGHGSTDDIHLRVQKIGVYLEQENVVDEFSNPMTLSSEYDKEVNLMQDEVRLLSEENLSRKRQRYDKDVNLMQDQVRLSSEENGSRKRRGYDKDVNLTQDQVRLSYEENRSCKRLKSNGVVRNAQ